MHQILVDDVGSFPLPSYTSRPHFQEFYWDAYRANLEGYDLRSNQGFRVNIIHPIETTFAKKMTTGLDVINFPQLMDMYSSFTIPMKDYEERENPHVIAAKKARVLEVDILKAWAKQHFEATGEKVKLKVCVTGPLELYFKEVGFGVYYDMALNFAKSVNRFLQNSTIKSKYIETTTIAIDEPSLGYVTITGAADEELIKIYDKSVENINADVQIHLHSLNAFKIPLQTKHINIMTCEFASNNQNLIDRQYLDDYDKFIRVGICRTNFNAIMADALDQGGDYQQLNQLAGLKTLIDSPEQIRHNLKIATQHYGDRLKYVGPDCGLNAWAPQELAIELLSRTVNVVKKFQAERK